MILCCKDLIFRSTRRLCRFQVHSLYPLFVNVFTASWYSTQFSQLSANDQLRFLSSLISLLFRYRISQKASFLSSRLFYVVLNCTLHV